MRTIAKESEGHVIGVGEYIIETFKTQLSDKIEIVLFENDKGEMQEAIYLTAGTFPILLADNDKLT